MGGSSGGYIVPALPGGNGGTLYSHFPKGQSEYIVLALPGGCKFWFTGLRLNTFKRGRRKMTCTCGMIKIMDDDLYPWEPALWFHLVSLSGSYCPKKSLTFLSTLISEIRRAWLAQVMYFFSWEPALWSLWSGERGALTIQWSSLSMYTSHVTNIQVAVWSKVHEIILHSL